MTPSAYNLGIEKIKESKIYGPTFTLILAKIKKYFTTLNKFDLSDELENKKIKSSIPTIYRHSRRSLQS